MPTPNQQLQNSKNGKSVQPTKVELLRLADSERKIGESTEEQIKSVLKYIIILLGLNEKDVPDDYEKAVILNFVITQYGNRFSCQDLRNAFDWGISGVFPVDKEIYGRRFSALYISRFMDNYGEYKLSMAKHYREPKKLEPPAPIQITEEEKEERIFNVIHAYVKEHRKIPPIYDIVSCYNTLVRQNKIVRNPVQDEINRKTAIEDNNKELNRNLFAYSPLELKNRRDEFSQPINLENEIKRQYLLSYWGQFLLPFQSTPVENLSKEQTE